MIKLTRTRDQIHPDFTGEKLFSKLVNLVEARIRDGDSLEFKGALGDWSKTKKVLKTESFGKCAYCESDTEKVAHGDVEHFRPKSIYWWLALCVDNYNFSCQLCNQTYKSDKFPVSARMLKAPKLPKALPKDAALKRLIARICPDPATVTDSELLKKWFTEDSDLPNPYLEDPEKLFAWAVSEVNEEVHLVAPTNAKPRAKRAVNAAVEYLGLNRETLTRSRFVVYNELQFALYVWQQGTREAKNIAKLQVERMCRSDRQYTGMARFFAKEAGFPL
ncbi:hypothetical protein [Hydrogenophaga sp.]|jgi:hypothetical protein|uniref:hypothetical protein n=1 Tax=Hydrogenophaga sp. TaxID=1904254 RepID=UPI003F70A66F